MFVDGKLETIIKKKLKFERVSQIGSNVYLSIRGKGLFLYKDRKLNIIKGTEVFKDRNQSVINVFENKAGLILVTRQSGIFSLINGNLTKFKINNDLFNETTVFNGIKLKDGRYAIGSTNGLFVFDSDIDLKIHIGTDTG